MKIRQAIFSLMIFFLMVSVAMAVPVSDEVPIQGRLTDANGNPLNGLVTIRFLIYDAAVNGDALCGNTASVMVINGLFNFNMDYCDADVFNGEQLWVGVKVGSDAEMTPRQPIYPVPYARSVRPGAIIKGATSEIFVPGIAAVKGFFSDTIEMSAYNGTLRVSSGATTGAKDIYIPITLPAVLYGQPVRVTKVTVYYKCATGSGGLARINSTALLKITGYASYITLVNDVTARESTTDTSYTVTTDPNVNTLSADQGILNLRLGLWLNDAFRYLYISGVRLTLEHAY